METRQNERARPSKKYNPYGDNFIVDKIDLKKIVEEFVVLEEMTASQDIVILDDQDKECFEDWSKSEVEFDDEQQQAYEQELKKPARLRVFE